MVQEPHRYTLRRNDLAITEHQDLLALLHSAKVGRFGVIAEGEPYVVPMNFAYVHEHADTAEKLIVHGASEGRFLRALQENPRICCEIDEFVATMPDPVLCEYTTAYASAICIGQARILESVEERTAALRILAQKYAPTGDANALKETTVEKFRGIDDAYTAVIEITLESITGKLQPVFAPPQYQQRSRVQGAPDLQELGNVSEGYLHHNRVVTPGELLVLHHALLKWYELRRGEVIIPREFIRESRIFLQKEAQAGSLECGSGLGFAILHYSDTDTYLIVGAWHNNQELWETLYMHNQSDGRGFHRVQPGIDAPTLCVWELAPVWHEREAWVRYLYSTRDETAKQAYLDDRFTAAV